MVALLCTLLPSIENTTNGSLLPSVEDSQNISMQGLLSYFAMSIIPDLSAAIKDCALMSDTVKLP